MKKNLHKIALLSFIIILPVVSFAQNTPNASTTGQIINPISESTLTGFIQTILQGVIRIGMPLIALSIIYSGFLFVAAQGNTEKLETAKKSLTYTVIGAAILLTAWALAQLISNTVLAL